MGVDEVVEDIKKYRSFMESSGGGMTISGGEPLLQPEFTHALVKRCKGLGIHTALDTAGYMPIDRVRDILDDVDLVLLDIKSFSEKDFKKVTHRSSKYSFAMAEHLNDIGKEVWIRLVYVPGLTDHEDNVVRIAKFAEQQDNVSRFEILPFHKMGEYKWEQLGAKYALRDAPTPTQEQLDGAYRLVREYTSKLVVSAEK